jgi:hypothetical protein
VTTALSTLREPTRARYPDHEGYVEHSDGVLGPVVGARWPVAMNLVLREFFESVRAGDARRQEALA